MQSIKHDVKRNLSSILAGTTLLLKNSDALSADDKNILIEMSVQCEETIKIFEKLLLSLNKETTLEAI
jgi:K+-sensing histidine kinase KdpD